MRLINKFVGIDYESSFLMILFDKLNRSSPMLTPDNINKYYHSESLKTSYINDGFTVIDNWNQYSALNDFFKLVYSSEIDYAITKEIICNYVKKNIDLKEYLKINDFKIFDDISFHKSIKKLNRYIVNNELNKFNKYICIFSKNCSKFKRLILLNFTLYIDKILKEYSYDELQNGIYLTNNNLKFELCILLKIILDCQDNINEFVFQWTHRNCKIIIENIFDNISSVYIEKDVLLNNLDDYSKDVLNTVLENNQKHFVEKCFDRSIFYTRSYIEEIFELNFLRKYSKDDKRKIIEYTFEKVSKDLSDNFSVKNSKEKEVKTTESTFENVSKDLSDFFLVYNNFIELLEDIFQDKTIKRDINLYCKEKNEIEYSIQNGFVIHNNLLDYDIVKEEHCKKDKFQENKYLDNLYKIILLNKIMKLISNKIKLSKSNKKERCIEFLIKNKTNYKYGRFEYLIDSLIMRLKLSNQFYALIILETLSKLFNFDYLNNQTLINHLHRDFNLNKKSATKYREVIANEIAFIERTVVFSKIHFNQN